MSSNLEPFLSPQIHHHLHHDVLAVRRGLDRFIRKGDLELRLIEASHRLDQFERSLSASKVSWTVACALKSSNLCNDRS